MLERPAPAASVVAEEVDDDVCLYRPDLDEVLVLNQTAADVWRLCDGETAARQIIELLAAAYQATPAAIDSDVQAVLDDLSSRGFLVESAGS